MCCAMPRYAMGGRPVLGERLMAALDAATQDDSEEEESPGQSVYAPEGEEPVEISPKMREMFARKVSSSLLVAGG